MNSKVKVIADAETNAVVNVSDNNPEYGWVRVQQVRIVIDDNGFLRRKPVSALIPGTVTDLKGSGFFAGQELPGNVLVIESLEPFNAKNPERDLKIAGDTGIVCTLAGQPIYRKTVYSMSTSAEDILVKHDNKDELRDAYARTAAKASITPNTDFDNI